MYGHSILIAKKPLNGHEFTKTLISTRLAMHILEVPSKKWRTEAAKSLFEQFHNGKDSREEPVTEKYITDLKSKADIVLLIGETKKGTFTITKI